MEQNLVYCDILSSKYPRKMMHLMSYMTTWVWVELHITRSMA